MAFLATCIVIGNLRGNWRRIGRFRHRRHIGSWLSLQFRAVRLRIVLGRLFEFLTQAHNFLQQIRLHSGVGSDILISTGYTKGSVERK